MVKSSPGVHPKPRFGPILNSTANGISLEFVVRAPIKVYSS